MKRDDFLARVRGSLGDLQPMDAPPPYRPPPAPARAELVDLLIGEQKAVGGIGHRATSRDDARRQVIRILKGRGTRRVIRGDTPLLRELDLDAGLEAEGVEVTVAAAGSDRQSLRDAAFAADVGITAADYGVAESGTLALLAAPGQGRAISLLPPVHIAILDARDIVLELAALFERVIADGGLPSALTFVTGPSRTGDIEQTLTVGVHGPGELHLIVID